MMGVHDALSLMWRDVGDAPWLVVVMVMPTAASLVAIVRGSLLGWVAPFILLSQLVVWFAYYATDAADPGLGVAIVAALAPWVVAAMASVAGLVTVRSGPHRA
jgi:hypothetical protein